jgi:hypothetical protein
VTSPSTLCERSRSGAMVPTTTAAGMSGVRRKRSAAAMWLGVNGIPHATLPPMMDPAQAVVTRSAVSRTARVAVSMFSSD